MMNFKIEKVNVVAKTRVLRCKCGHDKTFMTVRKEDTTRIKMRCEECIEPGDLKFDFSDPYVERSYGLEAEDEIVKALEQEIKFSEYKPYRDKYATFEEKYAMLLEEAIADEHQKD